MKMNNRGTEAIHKPKEIEMDVTEENYVHNQIFKEACRENGEK